MYMDSILSEGPYFNVATILHESERPRAMQFASLPTPSRFLMFFVQLPCKSSFFLKEKNMNLKSIVYQIRVNYFFGRGCDIGSHICIIQEYLKRTKKEY